MLVANKIAIIGDLHGSYNGFDNHFLESEEFDLALFVGDMGSGSLKNGLAMIRTISRLRMPGLLIPGNNDAPHLAQIKAELAFQSGKSALFRLMGPVLRKGIQSCGFSEHSLSTDHGGVSLIAARPCAMGGSDCSFAEQLGRTHGVTSIEESTERLVGLVDQAKFDDVIFLAHNGPFGLGDEADAMWGRDFALPERPDAPQDWGDRDLSTAIEYAKDRGKRVVAVIAGHMHASEHRPRPVISYVDRVSYINAAQVPRIIPYRGIEKHHFVELSIDLSAKIPVSIKERWVPLG